MADTIQIKRGLKAGIPTLAQGEMGYCTDTQELYIGTSSGNVMLGKVSWGADIERIDDDIGAMDITVADHANRIATLESQVQALINPPTT